MTILRTNTLSGIGTNGPVFSGNLEFNSQNYIVLPKGTTSDRVGVGSTPGALRYNTDSNKVELYDGSQWTEVQASIPLTGSPRGLFGAGTPGAVNTIDYVSITAQGNAIDFGDLTSLSRFPSACSSTSRGIFGGGLTPTPTPTLLNVIDYVTIASTGNAQDFGDLTAPRRSTTSCSSSTRGIFGGGAEPTFVNTINYVTMTSTGNALDFGDLTQTLAESGGCSSPTRGIFGGGLGGAVPSPSRVNNIDYITIASTGDARDFGDLTQIRGDNSGFSSPTRGVFGGGSTPTLVNTIDFITIATLGNAFDFGDLSQIREGVSGCSSPTRGLFGGGETPTLVNTIDSVTISTLGNAADFGDLTVARGFLAACSNAHGGL